ncbi:aminodeoxychorismate synthase component I [Azospira inquinata]|uniref:Aminodeoxychorismate synthase component I n=1 Tax=Azospira inquinata TaxID=2785627 RepID=A0A975SNJ6_9RHOO|nr:aminodeoxychorismate synthase component I [Azospira inquinata]QWT45026.1 aminodeoxychorismate synthase component I [Azospira inquinata]QWT49641.1 aminodeoxychorismate synthase component I [Azospira inquinata]
MSPRRETASGLGGRPAVPPSPFPANGFILSETQDGLRLFSQPSHHWRLTRDNWRSSLSQAEEARAGGAWLYLALDYELGTALEPRAAKLPGPEDGGLGHLWAFPEPRRLDEAEFAQALECHRASLPEARCYPGVGALSPALDEAAYTRAIQAIHAYIRAGDCYQVNFTIPLHFRCYGDPLLFYAALRRRQPGPLGALVAMPEMTCLSLSPELFVAGEGGLLTARPMKGTAPRGATAAEDQALAADLRASPKERAENLMIVDLLRNDLGRLAPPGGVTVPELFTVEAYPTLFQMTSTIQARGAAQSWDRLLPALFPCGSITGAPKLRAMEIIGELEGRPRGLYTGSLGWQAPDGRFCLNVAIRSLLWNEGGTGSLGVGSGITLDAAPDREYRECLLKARFLTDHDPGFALLETLGLHDGALPYRDYHRQRLEASARSLGFAFDPGAFDALLDRLAADHPQGRYRLRLSLDHGGRLTHLIQPLTPLHGEQRLYLAREVLDSGNYLLAHKTTVRGRYDQTLARVTARAGGFDALFLNERGEVCEGARSNLFLQLDGQCWTPALASGLLPGVLRRHLLDTGAVRERVLYWSDVQQAEALWMGNSLRGLVPVTLAGELPEA